MTVFLFQIDVWDVWWLLLWGKDRRALDILRDIHRGSSEDRCQVAGVNSLVKQNQRYRSQLVWTLDIGCPLPRVCMRGETHLNAPEATERKIANSTRYRFHVSEERVQWFSVGDSVIFKEPYGLPAKEKKEC